MSAARASVGSTVDERKQRKRMQNRLNQRASRSRKREKEAINESPSRKRRRRYHVDRWRLDETQVLQTAAPASSNFQNTRPSTIEDTTSNQLSSSASDFPLPCDHRLLHLIKYNAFRGLRQNKRVVDCLTMQYRVNEDQRMEPLLGSAASFPNSSVVFSVAPQFPSPCLDPTPSQMNVCHSSWINYIPFPGMRENLIKWEPSFDHADLVKDLVGDLINLGIFFSTPQSSPRSAALASMQMQAILEGDGDDDDDESTASSQSGLILWGEPYRTESWEATPEFLRKWSWAVADSQELMNSTNYWRVTRGETPLRLLVGGPSSITKCAPL